MSDQTKPSQAKPKAPAGTQDNSPEGVARRLFDLLLHAENRKDMDAIVDLWAVDGGAEFPFAVGDAPKRLDGREAVREYLAPYPEMYDVTDVPEIRFHRTTDPETVVAEVRALGRTVATGQPYEMRYVVIITVRDGEITWYRDYWSPVQAARASGNRGELISVLRAELDEEATA